LWNILNVLLNAGHVDTIADDIFTLIHTCSDGYLVAQNKSDFSLPFPRLAFIVNNKQLCVATIGTDYRFKG
jgi:hypothetical protein